MESDSIYLAASKRKWTFVLIASIAFVSFPFTQGAADGIADFGMIGFFGLGVLVSVVNLLPGANYLRLDPQGFTISSCFRKGGLRWADITSFGLVDPIGGLVPFVGYNLRADYPRARRARKFARGAVGWGNVLPDTYGRSAKELVALLEEWRTKYSGYSGHS